MSFKTFELDIFLDIYKCPFLKISVDFLTLFLNIMKIQGTPYDFLFQFSNNTHCFSIVTSLEIFFIIFSRVLSSPCNVW